MGHGRRVSKQEIRSWVFLIALACTATGIGWFYGLGWMLLTFGGVLLGIMVIDMIVE